MITSLNLRIYELQQKINDKFECKDCPNKDNLLKNTLDNMSSLKQKFET